MTDKNPTKELTPMDFPRQNKEAKLVLFEAGADPGPSCLCSYCGFGIYKSVTRITHPKDKAKEYRFHVDCGLLVARQGLSDFL